MVASLQVFTGDARFESGVGLELGISAEALQEARASGGGEAAAAQRIATTVVQALASEHAQI
jgi:hypothetical protein